MRVIGFGIVDEDINASFDNFVAYVARIIRYASHWAICVWMMQNKSIFISGEYMKTDVILYI